VADVALDQFILVVTAEADTLAAERRGRPLLRGGSPSTRLQPPDFLNFASGLVGLSEEDLARASGGHVHHDTGDGWGSGVPMVPGFTMLPAEMLLRPGARPRSAPTNLSQPPPGRRTEVVRLADGDTLVLVADAVTRRIHGRDHVMLAFNGQVPGPLLWVERGTSVHVRFVNRLTMPSTIHWHGLRHDFRMDGVPGLSQDPVPPGGAFAYTLQFPDAGLFWYHPHVREDVQQDLGLSGNIVVRGLAGLPPVEREEILLLDDILIGPDGLVPHGDDAVTHALMGRFGNVFLVNGEPRWQGSARSGETLRLWFTNAANTRAFNLSVAGAAMAVVASDLGAYERAEPVPSVVIAPAERYAVDVTLEGEGPWFLVNRIKALDHLFGRFVQQEDTLGVILANGERPVGDVATGDGGRVTSLPARSGVASGSDRALRSPVVRRSSPDFVFEFGLRTRDLPFVTERMMVLDSTYFHPIEWNGTMPMMNWATTSAQAEWFVRDAATGRENEGATFTVRRGDRKLLRLVNLRGTLHAMQHPIHLHGQRFQVLAVNGVATTNRAWKDTVLLPAGASVDILVEFTNPGHWMLHCHIAEHMESGMMTHFTVEER
jgi:FtsP/CotA-like multicopper oxidase with cupredoxin domain